ncbi:hypothetical protein OGATHE_000203 [Ogataea polymorpha]|uniref:Uncharacterized protein n=1 Tax=Ogataea polymorpha TaxID=460523 RepID=A0A9P8PUL2_9ASCO|nr:hypothetical protein OGATHE_000203 [Ogataea polymorpha]
MRFAHTHVWPEERNLQLIKPAAAFSRSASSKTTNGAFPPSSIDSRLSVLELCSISSLPTRVEPVKDTFFKSGDLQKSSPTLAVLLCATGTKFTTPSGTPASTPSTAIAIADIGVSAAGLITEVQPAARAAPSLRVIMASGKFHGVMIPTGPTGRHCVYMRFEGVAEGIVSP